MADYKLTGPVGLAPRKGDGEPVKNAAADVDLLRRMLRANGFGVPETGAADAGLLKAIAAHQKKIGFKTPDQIIDPVGKSFDTLRPKYDAELAQIEADARKLAELELVELTYQSKKYMVERAEYEALRDRTLKRIDSYIKTTIRMHYANMDIYDSYLRTAQFSDGVAKAVVQSLIISVGRVRWPDQGLSRASISAVKDLERAHASRDPSAIYDTLPRAEQAIQAFSDDVGRFLEDFGGSAGMVATTTGITSAVCFSIVATVGAPVIAKAAGMTLGRALVVSNAGAGALESVSKELGKHASGQDVTVWGSLGRVALDATVSALTAGIGNKISPELFDKGAKILATQFASRFPHVTAPQLRTFFERFLSGAGQELSKSAVSEAIKAMGKLATSEKMPTSDDFLDVFTSALQSAVLGGLIKNMEGFNTKWGDEASKKLSNDILPDRMSKLAKSNKISDSDKKSVAKDVIGKVQEEALKLGFGAIYDTAKGDEDVRGFTTIATTALVRDRNFAKLLDEEILKAFKKYKIAAK